MRFTFSAFFIALSVLSVIASPIDTKSASPVAQSAQEKQTVAALAYGKAHPASASVPMANKPKKEEEHKIGVPYEDDGPIEVGARLYDFGKSIIVTAENVDCVNAELKKANHDINKCKKNSPSGAKKQ